MIPAGKTPLPLVNLIIHNLKTNNDEDCTLNLLSSKNLIDHGIVRVKIKLHTSICFACLLTQDSLILSTQSGPRPSVIFYSIRTSHAMTNKISYKVFATLQSNPHSPGISKSASSIGTRFWGLSILSAYRNTPSPIAISSLEGCGFLQSLERFKTVAFRLMISWTTMPDVRGSMSTMLPMTRTNSEPS